MEITDDALILPRQMARRFGGDRDDNESAAMLGLLKATCAYKPERGVPAESFVRMNVRGALVDAHRRRRRDYRVVGVYQTAVAQAGGDRIAAEAALRKTHSTRQIANMRRRVEAITHAQPEPFVTENPSSGLEQAELANLLKRLLTNRQYRVVRLWMRGHALSAIAKKAKLAPTTTFRALHGALDTLKNNTEFKRTYG